MLQKCYVKLQFRAEFVNALNRPLFSGPDVGVISGTYGQILSARNTPRNIQFGMKLTF